jgi:hypothetical protein
MKRAVYIVGIVAMVMLASCGSDGASEEPTQSREKNSTSSANEADPLEGSWHKEVTCLEMLGALKQAGVAKSARGVVQDEFGLDQRLSQTRPCAGVEGTVDHSLRFEGGHFGLFAGDELGWEASYELIDQNTFVTGAPDVFTFDFRIEGDKLYTQITKPLKQAPYIATWESAPWEREN